LNLSHEGLLSETINVSSGTQSEPLQQYGVATLDCLSVEIASNFPCS